MYLRLNMIFNFKRTVTACNSTIKRLAALETKGRYNKKERDLTKLKEENGENGFENRTTFYRGRKDIREAVGVSLDLTKTRLGILTERLVNLL